jgi:hypothetical protein
MSSSVISVPISEFNVELAVSQELSYTDAEDGVTTVATLNMPADAFRAMFRYQDGALTFSEATEVFDGVKPILTCSPASILSFSLNKQAVSTSTSVDPNILDSFKTVSSVVNNTSMLGRNVLEHCLLQHASDRFSFIQAFVAIDQTSRNDFADELYSAGSTGTANIKSQLVNTNSVCPNLLLNISKLRQINNSATIEDIFQVGDSFFFSVTISATTSGFKQQYYKCKFILTDTIPTRCERYGIGKDNTLLLIENSANVYSFSA